MSRAPQRNIIREFSYARSKRVDVFRSLSLVEKLHAFRRLSTVVIRDLLTQLDTAEIVNLVEQLDRDEATDVLRALPEKRRKKLVAELSEQVQKDVELLLSFDPNTAADLMSLDFIFVESLENIAAAVKKVHSHEKRTGRVPTVLVMTEQKLSGFIPIRRLVIADPQD
jgi:magnesium transporter